MVVKRRPTSHPERVGQALRALQLGAIGVSRATSPAPVVSQPSAGTGTSTAPSATSTTGQARGLVAVEAAQQEGFDAATDPSAITATFRWGIDSGGAPYFNSAGVTAGDEAVLAIRPDGDDWQWVLVPIGEW